MTYTECKCFPDSFFWGASSSAYQCEGASSEDGKGESVQDRKVIPQGQADFKVASDFYHHYREDIAMMAEMGLKMYRFSIAWTRILPDGVGEVNEKGVQFYMNVIDTCLEYGIEPFVTLFHFDLPQALADKGGWLHKDTINAFENYARIVFEAYKDKVKYWVSINEQNMMIMHSEILGIGNLTPKDNMQQNHHMLIAQAKAMILCHSICPDAKIGPAPNVSPVYSVSTKPEDVLAAQTYASIRTWLYLDVAIHGAYNHIAWNYMREKDMLPTIAKEDEDILKAAKPDFIAFNYYNTQTVGAYHDDADISMQGDQQTTTGEQGIYMGYKNQHLEKTAFGWSIDPVGFRIALNEVYNKYRLPIFITENGIGGYDELTADGRIHDDYRIDFYRKHIEQMQYAIQDGVELLGYCPWSAMDLISTHQGYAKRYGFIYVDRNEEDIKSLKRYRKDSFYWYAQTIDSNGEKL